jgi:hypothetical protein
MNRRLAAFAGTLLLPAIAAAQQHPPATAFLPDEPQAEIFVDFKTMRDRGVWEEVERTLLAPAFRQREKELGLSLDGLDRLYMWARASGEPQRVQGVRILTGSVGLPPSVNGEHWTNGTIGDYEAKVLANGPIVMVRVGTDMLVEGDRELIEPVLLGKAKAGRPGPDQLSLLSGRTTELLHAFVDLDAALQGKGEFGFLKEIQYPEDDRATHLVFRVSTQRDGDDERLLLEAVVRHRKGEKGLELTEAGARKWLAEMQKHPRLAALKKIWSAVVVARDGADLTAKLDLGRPREAVGTMAQLMAPLFVGQAEAREQAAREAAEAAQRAALEKEKRLLDEVRRQKGFEPGGK